MGLRAISCGFAAVLCCLVCSSTSSRADDATIDFTYSGTGVTSEPLDVTFQNGSFTVPIGSSPVIGLSNLSAFNFGWQVSLPSYGNAAFNYNLNNLTNFSFNVATGSLNLQTTATPPVTASNPNFYPESFAVSSALFQPLTGSTINVLGTQSTTGTVSLDSQS